MNWNLMGKVGKVAGKAGLKLRKVSPELMLAGGLIAGGAAIVTACMATKKVVEEEAVKKAHEELDDIQMELLEGTDTEKGKRRESFRVYRKLVIEFAKAYGLPAFLLMLSVGLILGSHGVLKKRYISTTLAYKALDEAFKDYRKRIQEAVGEEREKHYFNGTEEGGETTYIDENGETKTVKKAVKMRDRKYSPYEFDWNAHTAPGNWEANSEYNRCFLQGIQNYANDLLHARGHVFLNEVLDAIGLERTPEGAVVGWILGGDGDDFVDFGLDEYYTDEYSDARDGYSRNIHLNFNVDGLIWDKI